MSDPDVCKKLIKRYIDKDRSGMINERIEKKEVGYV
jgi:hypothetical protein